MTPGILPILLHPPSTEADRVKAIKDQGCPERSRTFMIMIVVKRSMNVRRRDAAKLHAPHHESDPSAIVKSSEAPPTMYRQADSDRVCGRKSGGSRKE